MTALLAAMILAQIPKPIAEIPFEHEPGRIWIKAVLNGKPVDAMLDSGADESVADLDTALALHATKGKSYGWSAAGGDRSVPVWKVSGLALQISGLPYLLAIPNAVQMPTSASPLGKTMKLMIGLDFLREFTIVIDYALGHIRFFDPKTYLRPVDCAALDLIEINGTPVASGRLRLPGLPSRKVTIAFDTGSPVGMVVTNRMVRQDALVKRFANRPLAELRERALGGGLSLRQIDGIQGELGSIPLNGTAFLSLTEGGGFGKDADADVIVGDELLRHLDVVFDLPNSRMYVRPNGD